MTKQKELGATASSPAMGSDESGAGLAPDQAPRAPGRPVMSLLTAGRDRHYTLDLARSLIAQGVAFDFIGSDNVDSPELHESSLVRFLNLRGHERSGMVAKAGSVARYYFRLIRYAATSKAKLFHLVWNNKFEHFDRTLLLLYYRLLGKRLLLTVHNVNIHQRDGNETWFNQMTLRIQYHLTDRLFVHTERMKQQLKDDFDIPEEKIRIIPFGINCTAPNTGLTKRDARKQLELSARHRVVLFFGNIAPYKGLEYLVDAMALLPDVLENYRLIVAGRPKGPPSYWEGLQRQITEAGLRSIMVERIKFIPDAETELYFKAADVLVLPYTNIFQSAVLFMGYAYGLPVIASDVGSLKDDILEGRTGYVFEPRNPDELAERLNTYFHSDLYQNLDAERKTIRDLAHEKHSWDTVGEITKNVYEELL